MKITSSRLTALAEKYGFPQSGVVSLSGLKIRIQTLINFQVDADHLLETILSWLFPAGESAGQTGTILLCGFPFDTRGHDTAYDSTSDNRSGIIAPFAAANYYKYSVMRLKHLAVKLAPLLDLPVKAIRLFSNSRLPEKLLAFLAGLGFYARNSLIINPVLGSNFVISGLFIPLALPDDTKRAVLPQNSCHTCNRCMLACPASAIDSYASVNTARCLQALATEPIVLTDEIKEVWGNRIYGCRSCQDVCPYNRNIRAYAGTALGQLGMQIPLSDILIRNETELKIFFKHTALGMPWIDMRVIQRNAIIAAGNNRCRGLLPLLRNYLECPAEFIVDAAEWAVRKISTGHR